MESIENEPVRVLTGDPRAQTRGAKRDRRWIYFDPIPKPEKKQRSKHISGEILPNDGKRAPKNTFSKKNSPKKKSSATKIFWKTKRLPKRKRFPKKKVDEKDSERRASRKDWETTVQMATYISDFYHIHVTPLLFTFYVGPPNMV